MATQEKRRYERYPASHEMGITSPTGDRRTYLTLDISDGGIFVVAMKNEQLPVGTVVTINPSEQIFQNRKPAIKGRVARRSRLGMGIEFLDLKPG